MLGLKCAKDKICLVDAVIARGTVARKHALQLLDRQLLKVMA